MTESTDTGVVLINGKHYKTVALRVQEFRERFPDHTLETKIIGQGDLVTVKAIIIQDNGRVLSTGHAEENRAFGSINKTSAVENCETSAVGRALAFLGFGGTELASADEVANAIGQQNIAAALEPILQHNETLKEVLASVYLIKVSLLGQNYSAAKEAWQELTEKEQRNLWLSPTNGGIFTDEESNQMKSPEWNDA